MESSYQTISQIPMAATIANIISSKSSFSRSNSSSSLSNHSAPTPVLQSQIPVHSPSQKSYSHAQIAPVSSSSSTPHQPTVRSPGGSVSINLCHKGLTAEQLLNLSKRFPLNSNIATLKLGFNEISDEGAKIISSLLVKNRSITCLDLGFCNIGDEGAEAMAAALLTNQTLKVLYLSGNLLTAKGFKSLSNCLSRNKTLQALYLTGNNGQFEGAKYLTKGLKFNSSLQKLYINGNKLESDGATSLSDTLLTNHTLTSLNLSDNGIGDSGLLSLSEAMANHRNLKELELSFNKISAVGMVPFIDSLIGYHSLQKLYLDNNKLGDAGAKSLSLALPHLNLFELNIGFNDIGGEGLLPIIAGLANNKALALLVLSGNTLDNNVAKALANFLITNCILHSLQVDRTNLSSVGERYLATAIATNRTCALRTLTGFELGKVLHILGSPAVVCEMRNEQALKYLSHMWKTVEKSKQNSYPANASALSVNYHPQTHIPVAYYPQYPKVTLNPVMSPNPHPDKTTLLAMARSLKELPFNEAELWALYQYFYSPPVSSIELDQTPPQVSTNTLLNSVAQTPYSEPHRHDRPFLEDSSRPMKKPVNRYTVSRISNYQHIKNLLEEYKSNFNEEKSLLIMRQLKFLEDQLKLDPIELENLFLDEVLDH